MSSPDIHVFSYTGRNASHQLLEGQLRAPNIQWAKHKLRKRGIRILSIKRCWHLPFNRNQIISSSDITLFTRQLATLLKVGVPIRKSFDILTNSYDKPIVKMLVREISDDISVGESLAKALRKHPQQFDNLFCNMVKAGELSGALITTLERLAGYREQSEQLKRRVKKALSYPCIVLSIAILVTAIMLTQVVPRFAQIFSEFGADLPLFTLFVLKLSELFQQLWPYILVICIACYSSFSMARKKSATISQLTDRLILRLPIVGKLIKNLILARFAHSLATTFNAGLPILDALKSTASTVSNSVYSKSIHSIRQDITHGISLHRAIGKQSVFPVTLQQMITVGEESGSLGQILDRAGQLYEGDVELALDTIIPLIEPLMMLTLGLLIGGLLVAMYLPIFQLGHII